jgi:predicted RNA binding protein YcfA (HicA-like mRNA interferase family)
MMRLAARAPCLRAPVTSTLGLAGHTASGVSADVFGARRLSVYAGSMKVAEILRLLQQDGWFLAAQRGSHRQFKHASKPGRVTVPGKPSDDLAPGTQNSILKQAGLK